ncbi:MULTISPECIES: hypothetical protein [Cryobacterium]|uniref:Uncharacterized protein n=1 Tax=Cryobacterium zongtaii TaxID=1259217 RepID=A0A2S3ZMF5_9MICO|nr:MULTISPECIES: hypothetical protein [Cryobacterium]POH68482.1 hypothetical protein C3B60_04615 [Cryobacterium zongtaii]POH70099.1 hypothetical protein C3B61_00300 [Cryobacterium zongtaii]TFC49168.1 hypothetical protein E3O57_00440 [Cryobacterium sp. TMN-39-2]
MRQTPQTNRTAGFTLVELLIYSLLLVLVVFIGGGLLAGSSRTTTLVRSMTTATSLAQKLTSSVQAGVRDAVAIKTPYTPTVAAVGVAGTQLLVVETTTGGATSSTQCQAWFYVPSHGGQLFVRTVPLAAIVPPNVAYLASLPANTPAAAPTGWQIWGEGVNQSGALPFTRTGNQIGISLSIDAGTSPDVKVVSSALDRQPTVGATSTCF